jgi:hypothetical protein
MFEQSVCNLEFAEALQRLRLLVSLPHRQKRDARFVHISQQILHGLFGRLRHRVIAHV